jgi:F0F1-type ATP synthase assembly protein I
MGKKKKYKSSVYQSLAVITQFGINMLVPIFLCAFIGLFIDRKFGTSFWFVVLFFVGALAGFKNIYILAKKIYDTDKDGDRHD